MRTVEVQFVARSVGLQRRVLYLTPTFCPRSGCVQALQTLHDNSRKVGPHHFQDCRMCDPMVNLLCCLRLSGTTYTGKQDEFLLCERLQKKCEYVCVGGEMLIVVGTG